MSGTRIGILGGRFDPVHLGHLETARAARRGLALTRVLLLPSGPSPHRSSPPAAGDDHRLAMTRLAAATAPWLEVSDLELRSEAPAYTAVTLAMFATLGFRRTQIFFIVGADAFAEIATWYDYPDVLDGAHFVVVSRPGYPVETLRTALAWLAPRMRTASAPPDGAADTDPAIHLLDAATPAISSTLIRARVARGEPLDGLVPPDVAAYIEDRRLYRPTAGE